MGINNYFKGCFAGMAICGLVWGVCDRYEENKNQNLFNKLTNSCSNVADAGVIHQYDFDRNGKLDTSELSALLQNYTLVTREHWSNLTQKAQSSSLKTR